MRALPAVAFYTLGCKLNQEESEAIAGAFRSAGFPVCSLEEGDAAPGIIIINTCTVTSKSEQKARRIIRKCLGDYPEAVVIVTGCYAQLEKENLERLDKRLLVIPGARKDKLLDLPELLVGGEWESGVGNRESGIGNRESGIDSRLPLPQFRFAPEEFNFHSRAFLKVQDGCDNRCAYCRVRFARGASSSLAPEEALARLKALEERGFTEAALTGVNLCQYRAGGLGLGGLLEFLLRGTERIRLRLSSLEPEFLTPSFTAILKDKRIRPHFHLSLQSGSPAVLARMGRRYGPEEVLRGVSLLREAKDDPFLACDVITGFPGEGEAEFQATRELCRSIDFAWIHAFPFSRRPGTPAWDFRPRVSERDAGLRVEALLAEARRGRRAYVRRWEGRELEAVILAGPAPAESAPGLSENYLKLNLFSPDESPLPPPGTLVRCRILPPEETPGTFDAPALIIYFLEKSYSYPLYFDWFRSNIKMPAK